MAKFIDLTGQKFGYLTVVSRGPNDKHHKATWYCVCDCGNDAPKFIATSTLKSNHTTSCGCAQIAAANSQVVDLTGKKFGKLTVVSQGPTPKSGKAVWYCECDCGNKPSKPVLGFSLKSGKTASCGCKYKKVGQAKVAKAAKDFPAKAAAVHGDGKYDYSRVFYAGNQSDVSIGCNTCGAYFPQTPNVHLKGGGCSTCAGYGFDPLAPAIFYYALLQLPSGLTAYMIGITNRTFEARYSAADRAHMDLIDFIEFPVGADALALETQLKQDNRHLLYTGEMPINKGNTEVYVVDIEPFERALEAA